MKIYKDEDDTNSRSDAHNSVRKDDLVAVYTDDPGEDYYLLKATHDQACLDNNEGDYWGSEFREGCEVVRGFYYKQKPNQLLQYKLITKKTLLSVNSILCVVPLTANNAIIIPTSTHENLVGMAGECMV